MPSLYHAISVDLNIHASYVNPMTNSGIFLVMALHSTFAFIGTSDGGKALYNAFAVIGASAGVTLLYNALAVIGFSDIAGTSPTSSIHRWR